MDASSKDISAILFCVAEGEKNRFIYLHHLFMKEKAVSWWWLYLWRYCSECLYSNHQHRGYMIRI